MANSYSQIIEMDCPNCQHHFASPAWQIVDINERPDLLIQLQQEKLNLTTCPKCQRQAVADTGLMIFRPHVVPHLLFSPADGTSDQQDREDFMRLMGVLQQALGMEHLQESVDKVITVPRPFLGISVIEDPEEAREAFQSKVMADIEAMRANPERFSLIVEAMERATESIPELKAITLYLQMRTWMEQRLLVERRPELLSENVDLFLGTMAQQAHAIGHLEYESRIRECYSVVRRCREIGIDAAFEERALHENTPAEMKMMYQALRSLPDDQRMPLSEIFINAESQDDLTAKLESHRELADVLAGAMQRDNGQAQAAKYRAHFLAAKDAEKSFENSQTPVALDEAIEAYGLILNNPDFPTSSLEFQKVVLNDSAINFARRFTVEGRKSDLDQAITLTEKVVSLVPPESDGYALCLMNLSAFLRERHQFFGNPHDAADVDRAIALSREALELQRIEPNHLPGVLGSLVGGLMDRYKMSSARSDLEEAVEKSTQALEICLTDSPEYLALLNNMGVCLQERYDRYGDISDLDDAINNYRRVVSLRKNGADKGMALSNLGNALRRRFRHTLSSADSAESVNVYREAVSMFPEGSPDLHVAAGNLATSLIDRFDREKNRDDLIQALEIINRAVKAVQQRTEVNTLQLLGLLVNRGLAYESLYKQSEDLADLDHAIDSLREALANAPEGYGELPGLLLDLGNVLRTRYRRLGISADLDEGIKTYSMASQKASGVSPQVALSIARQWGSWALQRAAWAEAFEAYRYGVETMDQLVKSQLLLQQKEDWLKEVRGIFAGCAYALANTGNLAKAIEVLEQGRAQMLSEVVARERSDLESISTSHPELLSRYSQAVDTLASVRRSELARMGTAESFLNDDVRQQSRGALNELDTAIKEIRQIEGYQSFLEHFTIDQILQVAQAAPLIYLAATEVGGLAILITGKGELVPVWLKDLLDEALEEHVWERKEQPGRGETYIGAYSSWRRNSSDDDATYRWNNTLDSTLRWLWDALMGPLNDVLDRLDIDRVTLIPQGVLGLLPLHAAWIEDKSLPLRRRYAMDIVTFAYAANAQCLAASLLVADEVRGDELLVVNSLGAEDPLPALEIAGAVRCFGPYHSLVLQGKSANRDTTLKSLTSHSVFHFSTHGYVDMEDPRNSGLQMADGENLRLNHLLSARLHNARLAVLSACESAIPGDPHLLDEVLSLPAGLVQAGVAGAIGSLWLVYVLDAALITSRFYDYWKNDGIDPIESIRKSQLWMRDSSNGDKRAYFKKTLPEYESLFSLIIPSKDELCSFADPIHWAAFVYVGA